LEKEDFIYVADCKLCSQENLNHIARNEGFFITIVPKGRKEVKQFLKHLRKNDVEWKNAFEVESSRKKGKMNIYKTFEPAQIKNEFRIIFVHSSSKQAEDEGRRRKKTDKAIARLEEVSPKLNAYHLKTNGSFHMQAMVKGLSALHEHINWLLEIPDSVYKILQPGWWQFRET